LDDAISILTGVNVSVEGPKKTYRNKVLNLATATSLTPAQAVKVIELLSATI
jgi:hypothetical protein